MILKLYQDDSKEGPNYILMKNIFDYIDVRKDGIIDQNEWITTFNSVEV